MAKIINNIKYQIKNIIFKTQSKGRNYNKPYYYLTLTSNFWFLTAKEEPPQWETCKLAFQ